MCGVESVAKGDSSFLARLRQTLRETGERRVADQKGRHPARESNLYETQKTEAAAAVDELCDRLVREIQSGIAEIDDTVGPIAEPLEEQLAKGAVSDVFEAAAQVLKSQIRRNAGRSS